jgi:hypothetical protein
LLVPTVLVFLPYQGARTSMGLARNLDGWGTAPSSFFASPSYVDVAILKFFPAWLREAPDAYLFPGWVPLLLVLAGCVALVMRVPRAAAGSTTGIEATAQRTGVWAAIQRQRTNAALFYALLTVACVWLLLGPPFGIWPLVYKWPVLNFIRVPTRFVLLGLVGLALLAGMALDRLSSRLTTRARTIFAVVISVVCLAEFAVPPMDGLQAEALQPAIDRWMKSLPKPFTVAETPMPDPDNVDMQNTRNARFMLHSSAHWQKTIHGFSGLLPPTHEALYGALYHFPDDRSLNLLADFNVTYVIVHENFTDPKQQAATTEQLAPFATWLTFVHEEADGRVYALHRPKTY